MSEDTTTTGTLSSELFGFCESDSLSEERLGEIFERHGLMPANNDTDDYVENYEFFLEACYNARVTEGIIRCLLEYFPAAASASNEDGWSPLHVVCCNKNVTLNIIQLLIDAAPNSVRSETNHGNMPLHYLYMNTRLDETTAVKILRFLLEKCPEAVRHADSEGRLPIHVAASWGKSPEELCSVLIEAYPGSERATNAHGALPLHHACLRNTVAMVEYLYNLFPNAINTTTTREFYPIHSAILGIRHRDTPAASVEVVQFLLNCDPSVKLQKHRGTKSLLHFACRHKYDDAYIEAALEVIKVIYDFYPEAIEDNGIISDIEEYHQEVQVFVLIQLGHARQAKVHRLMTTPDTTGQLPLHTALRNNSACFGSIKLLVKGNPEALQSADNRGRLPLHVACQYYDSVSVIQYLVGLDPSTWEYSAPSHLPLCKVRYHCTSLG